MGLSGTRNTVHFYRAGYTSDHSHSKCRCHPYRFLRHERRRTCPLVIQLFPPWFDETPQPSSTIHEDVLPPAPSFDETPFVTAPVPETPTIPSVAERWRPGALHPVPETPTIPSVAKRWRSGALHLENPESKRWRSGTLHPETPVPTTTPPQLRWRASVLRALRPFRRLRDTQSDPLERVKRSRLAPAQVMSTALARHCDWSLGFDGRGPVFDETQDWRHSIFLTGRAARKEVYSCFRVSSESAFVACGHGA